MITKKFYQKYLLVLFHYPPELVLEQYMNMSNPSDKNFDIREISLI